MSVRHQVTKFLWHGLGDKAENTCWHYREVGRNLVGIFDMVQELRILEIQSVRIEVGFTEFLNILKYSVVF